MGDELRVTAKNISAEQKPAQLEKAKGIKDPQAVEKAVNKDWRAFEKADPALKKSKVFILKLVKRHPQILTLADHSILTPDFVLEAVKENADVLKNTFFSDSDRENWLSAVMLNWQAVKYLPKQYRADEEFFSLATEKSLFALNHANRSLKQNLAFMLNCFQNNWFALEFADPILKKDTETMLSAIALDWRAIYYTDISLKAQASFMLKAIGINPDILKSNSALPLSLQNNPDFIFELSAMKERLSPSLSMFPILQRNISFAANLLAAADDYGIDGLNGRFANPRSLLEILINRANLKEFRAADTRPMVLIFYAKADYNKAFQFSQIDELIMRGYRVIYYEVAFDHEIYQGFREATRTAKTSLVIIAGHGRSDDIALSDIDPRATKRRLLHKPRYLDLGDADELAPLSKRVAANGKIVLAACSTNEGKKNLAGLFRKKFPKTTVYALDRPAGIGDTFLEFDKNNQITGIYFKQGKEKNAGY